MPTKVLTPTTHTLQARNGRSYLLPPHLPAQPTHDDLDALEQYLSRVSGSTETLHQGLAKAYLPSILQDRTQPPPAPHDPFQSNGPTSASPATNTAPHEFQPQGLPLLLPPLAHFDFLERFRQLAQGQASSARDQAAHGAERLGSSGTPFPLGGALLPNQSPSNPLAPPVPPYAPTPQAHPTASNSHSPRETDKDSIAPSQSLSQVALRNQQRARRLGQPLISETSAEKPLIPARQGGKDGQPSKEMALLDWARSVSGPQQAARPVVPSSERHSPLGGTNVDRREGSGSSSTSDHGDTRRVREYHEEERSFDGYPRSEARSSRAHQGDPGSVYDHQYLHPTSYPFPQQPRAPGSRQSAPPSQFGWQSPVMTERIPRDDEVSMMDHMTVGGTTVGGLTTAGGVPFSSMGRMRSALEDQAEGRCQDVEREGHRRSHPSHATSDVDRLQSQVRTLQARIIAEHVSRSTLEKDVVDKTEQAREYRTELANAVRALKRAKEETRKLDEERKKGMRLYEETRERLVKYHEALKVTEARDAGREEGRLEAFHEIERWMTAPPIPIEPLGNLPLAVMRHMDSAHGQAAAGDGHRNDSTGHAPQRETRQTGNAQSYHEGQSPGEAPLYRGPAPGNASQGQSRSEQPLPGTYRGEPSQMSQAGLLNAANQDYRDQRHTASSANAQYVPRPSPGQTEGFVPVRQTPPMHPETLTPHNAADAYLDRVQHDSRLQGLLEGPPGRSFPMTSNSTGPALTQPFNNQPSQFRRHSSNLGHLDKPLPSPHQSQHRRYVSNGSQSQYASSQMGGGGRTSVRSGRHHTGLHHRDDGKQDRGMAQPDRYPPFPTQPARSILDHAVPVLSPDDQSYRIPPGYIDPRHIPLPDSRTVSEFGASAHHTRQASGPSFVSNNGAANRSRLAVGLRNEDDLSIIEERDERSTGAERSPRMMTQPMLPTRGNIKAARSMQSLPSWKPKPKIVMPKRLGGPGTDIQEMPALNEEQLRELYGRRKMERGPGNLEAPPDAYREIDPQSMHRVGGMPSMTRNEDLSRGADSRHNANNVLPLNPAHVPLPPTRPGTVYGETMERNLPAVSVIDFARAVPLPASRAGTVLSYDDRYPLQATVETVPDREAPHHRLPGSILKRPSSADRSPNPGRRKTSTFVTVESKPRSTRNQFYSPP